VSTIPTEISSGPPKAALNALFLRIAIALRDVFSAKSISIYRLNCAACGPFYLTQGKNDPETPVSSVVVILHTEEIKKAGFTHSEAPETRVATRAKAYDLYLTLARKTKPTIKKMIDPPRAEVGAYVD